MLLKVALHGAKGVVHVADLLGQLGLSDSNALVHRARAVAINERNLFDLAGELLAELAFANLLGNLLEDRTGVRAGLALNPWRIDRKPRADVARAIDQARPEVERLASA